MFDRQMGNLPERHLWHAITLHTLLSKPPPVPVILLFPPIWVADAMATPNASNTNTPRAPVA